MDPIGGDIAIEIGRGLAIAGAGLAVGLGCAGSAKGIGTASQAAAGVISEKPNLFGQLLVMIALPGTQGFYGFITAIMIFMSTGLIEGSLTIAPSTGVALLFMGSAMAMVTTFTTNSPVASILARVSFLPPSGPFRAGENPITGGLEEIAVKKE